MLCTQPPTATASHLKMAIAGRGAQNRHRTLNGVTMAIEPFFLYGSLMDPELLALVIGRATDGLRFEMATVHGFLCRRALNESFPVLVPHAGGQVVGVLVFDLTSADVARLQFYEGSWYALEALPVECCGGEVLTAQVFLPTAHIAADEMVWDFDAWAAVERPLFMALVQECMSRYGTLSAAENDALWPRIKAEVERRFRARRGDA